MLGEIDLTRQVKDALKNLWDLSRLQVHPLLEMIAIPCLPTETAGEALHRQLREAVDMLKPPASLQAHRKEWVSYRLLCLLYVETMSRRDVERELCLSERTFYRRHREAIEAVASILWEQRHTSGVSVDSNSHTVTNEKANIGERPARKQSQRQTEHGSYPVGSLQDTLANVLDTIRPLFVAQACSLLVDIPQDLPATCDGETVLRQIVADALLGALEAAGPKALNMQVSCRDSATLRCGSGQRDTVSFDEMQALSSGDRAVARTIERSRAASLVGPQ